MDHSIYKGNKKAIWEGSESASIKHILAYYDSPYFAIYSDDHASDNSSH